MTNNKSLKAPKLGDQVISSFMWNGQEGQKTYTGPQTTHMVGKTSFWGAHFGARLNFGNPKIGGLSQRVSLFLDSMFIFGGVSSGFPPVLN